MDSKIQFYSLGSSSFLNKKFLIYVWSLLHYLVSVDPFPPWSDWHVTFPYNSHTLLSKQVMRTLR